MQRIRRAVGEPDHHRQVVRDDVVHLPRDPGTLGGGAEPALLVALELQPSGALLQRRQQRPALPDRDAEHCAGDAERGQPDPVLGDIARRPPRGGHHRAGLGHDPGDDDRDERSVEREPVERHEHRYVRDLRGRGQPLRERDPGDQSEAERTAAPPDGEWRAQQDAEDDRVRLTKPPLDGEPDEARRRDQERNRNIDDRLVGSCELRNTSRVRQQPSRQRLVGASAHQTLIVASVDGRR